MSRRPNVQASKVSAFSDILSRHRESHADAELQARVVEPGKQLAKSKDPAYVKLTSYIRKETYLAAKRRLLDNGGGQISDVIEELLAKWAATK